MLEIIQHNRANEDSMVLHNFQPDMVELNHLLKVAERRSFREVICNEIDIILTKATSLQEQLIDGVRMEVKWPEDVSRIEQPANSTQPNLCQISVLNNGYKLLDIAANWSENRGKKGDEAKDKVRKKIEKEIKP